jgi:hypothetical protein
MSIAMLLDIAWPTDADEPSIGSVVSLTRLTKCLRTEAIRRSERSALKVVSALAQADQTDLHRTHQIFVGHRVTYVDEYVTKSVPKSEEMMVD